MDQPPIPIADSGVNVIQHSDSETRAHAHAHAVFWRQFGKKILTLFPRKPLFYICNDPVNGLPIDGYS